MSKTVTLSKALVTHKGEMKELTLKEPSARCFVQHGEPFTIRFVDGKLEIDYSKSNDSMMKFLADMSGVDSPEVVARAEALIAKHGELLS